MSTLNIVTAPISEEKLEYVKAFLKALKIQFNVSKEGFINAEDKYDDIELTDKQKDMLNERLEDYKNNPNSYLDVDEVKNSIKKNYEL